MHHASGWISWISVAYSEPGQISKMVFFAKIVKGFQPLNPFAKRFILDIWQGSDYDSNKLLFGGFIK